MRNLAIALGVILTVAVAAWAGDYTARNMYATNGFFGNLVGNVVGNLVGNVTGNVIGNVTGSLQQGSVNSMLNVRAQPYNAACDGTTDDTAHFQSAVSGLGSGGGMVYVPISPAGCVIAGKVTFPRNVVLQGAGALGTVISCTGQTAACLVWADGNGDGFYPHGGARDVSIQGPGTATTSIGVYTGGDPTNLISPATNFGDYEDFYNVRVTNFGTGYKLGNNSWGVTWMTSHLVSNGTNVYEPAGLTNSGERISFVSSDLNNSTVNAGRFDYFAADNYFVDDSITYNVGPMIGDNFHAWFTDCHFQQHNGTFIDASASTFAKIFVHGGQWLLDATSGTDDSFIKVGGNNSVLSVMSAEFFTSHTVTQLINFSASGGSKQLTVADLTGGGPVSSLTNTLTPFTFENIDQGVFGSTPATHIMGGTLMAAVIGNNFTYGTVYSASPGPPLPMTCTNDEVRCTSDTTTCTNGSAYVSGGSTRCQQYCASNAWKATGAGC